MEEAGREEVATQLQLVLVVPAVLARSASWAHQTKKADLRRHSVLESGTR